MIKKRKRGKRRWSKMSLWRRKETTKRRKLVIKRRRRRRREGKREKD